MAKKATKATTRKTTTGNPGAESKVGRTKSQGSASTAVAEHDPASATGPYDERARELIERRAYEIWIERGGDAESNWFDAEAELREEGQL